jgi:hypothetical protein
MRNFGAVTGRAAAGQLAYELLVIIAIGERHIVTDYNRPPIIKKRLTL